MSCRAGNLTTQCTTCGAMDEHERKDCPYSMVCFICGKQGHRRSVSRLERAGSPSYLTTVQDCTDPKAKESSSRNCPDCGGWDHAQSVRSCGTHAR